MDEEEENWRKEKKIGIARKMRQKDRERYVRLILDN